MKIENGYLIIDNKTINKFKKITGHSFVGLIGEDKYKKVGDYLLSMHGFYSEEIDDKWLKRGEFAEKIIQHYYKKEGHNITIYNKEKINYDNFTDYLWYGGLIDIELLDEQTLIEVKSKSMKDYNKICNNPPFQEVLQGMYYGYLRKYDSIKMEWVFFDEKTEKEIFEDRPVTTLKNIKKFSKTYKIDNEFMKEKLEEALMVVKNFRESGKIHLSNISDKVLNSLGFDRNELLMNELPF